MLSCTLVPAEDQQPAILRISGEATIAYAQQLKEALVDALNVHPNLVVDCQGVAEADFSCLQVLCSAHRTCQTLRLTIASHAALADAIEDAGLDRFVGCAHADDKQSCLWIYDHRPPETPSPA